MLPLFVLLPLVGMPPRARAADGRVDQHCDAEPRYPAFYAAYTVSQTFTPTVSHLDGVAVRLGVIDKFVGDLTARLVFHPAGDVDDPTANPPAPYEGPGVVLATAQVAVDWRVPFTRFWKLIPFDAPVVAVPVRRGTYAVEIDFPADPTFRPYGAHLGWAVCGADYPGGAAYAVVGPDAAMRAARDFGSPYFFDGLPTQPGVGERYVVTDDFSFRVYGT